MFINETAERIAKRFLIFCACLYGLAALIHFTHNAEYLSEYPNMPTWITRGGVYGVWAAEALLGLLGLVLLKLRFNRLSATFLGLYAALGFDGLLHYRLAPMQAHSFAMNFTILFEVATGAVLLFVVLKYFAKHHGQRTRAT